MKSLIIISGPVDSGKTEFLKKLAGELSGQQPVRGFVAPKFFLKQDFKGYDFLELENGFKCPFIQTEERSGWMKFGRFYFNPVAFELGNRIISAPARGGVLIVDEVGPLELAGEGFRQGLDGCRRKFKGTLVVSCREFLVGSVRGILETPEVAAQALGAGEWEKIRSFL